MLQQLENTAFNHLYQVEGCLSKNRLFYINQKYI